MFDYSGMVVHKYALVYGVSRYTMQSRQDPDRESLPEPGLSGRRRGLRGGRPPVVGVHGAKSRWVDASGNVIVDGSPTSGRSVRQTTTPSGHSPIPGVGVGQAPTKATILPDIQNITPSLGPNDVLVVYFSGHGTQDTGSPPREYFDPYEGVAYFANAVSPDFYADPARSIRDDDLRAVFDASSTPRKVLILDTCNSGGFIGNQLEVDATPSSYTGGLPLVTPGTLVQAIANYSDMQASPTGLSPYGAQVLSAAGKDELSYESSSLGHGVLTYYLLQGLQGSRADLNNDGHVTVLEAFAYAKAGVDQNWNGNSGVVAAQATFEPRVSGGPVDFVLF